MLDFSARLIAWQRQSGRHDLPWQGTRDPYRIWLSEIMLQQTQVKTVIPYYQAFLTRFPEVRALADAPLPEVLALWAGLGYYRRARYLHEAAQTVVAEYGGVFPVLPEQLQRLPGVGESTAAAIAVFATGTRAAILDGNVKRVLARHAGVTLDPGSSAGQRAFWELARARLPETDLEAYTQGLMDLGSQLCVRASPDCGRCPVARDCHARQHGIQSELPRPPARRGDIQERVWYVWLISDGQRLVLERRPASGIWPGMMCVPVSEEDVMPPTVDVAQIAGVEAWPTVIHRLTHRRLLLQPRCVTVRSSLAHAPSLQVALQAGLPRPIRELVCKWGSETAKSLLD